MGDATLEAETRVARTLRGLGAQCTVGEKLPGSTDLLAEWPSGNIWRVMVKATTVAGKDPTRPSNSKRGTLKATASNNKQTEVVAWVWTDGAVKFFTPRGSGKCEVHPRDARGK